MLKKMINEILQSLTYCALLMPALGLSQTPSASITDWMNDARGAYTIIHDDYGDRGVDGIWQYADTICANRGIQFTFGAIAQSCENTRDVNGYADPYEYAKNVMIAQHGHEIISHSHTHDCAVGNAGWSPCDAPVGQAWGEDENSSNFNTQLVTAHNSIAAGTGFSPVYYIFPYDRFTQAANEKLKDMGYIGSRTGWTGPLSSDPSFHRNGYENSDESTFYPDADGFFRTAVEVFDDNDRAKSVSGQAAELNGEVDNAMNNNMWTNRELHNVGSSGWGSVSVEAYRQHINYIAAKKDAGELWVATVSDILTYQYQKLNYSPQVNYNQSSQVIDVTWSDIGWNFTPTVSSWMDPLERTCPVTVCVDLDGLTGEWTVMQNGVPVAGTWQENDKIYANVYPHEGALQLTQGGDLPNQTPYIENPIDNYSNLQPDFNSFEINLYEVFEDFETEDVNLIFTSQVTGNIDLDISGGTATISSQQGATGVASISITAEDEGGLQVSETFSLTIEDMFDGHTPYNGAVAVPGRIEAENFDNGIEGVTYYEVSSQWEPDPADNPYRPNHPVDIANVAGVGYVVNYIVTGEWLEYTIDVGESAFYDVVFRIAQPEDQRGTPVGQIKILIDNEEWIPATSMKYTSGWEDFQDVQYIDGGYLEKGGHVLRIEFTSGSLDLDYIDISEMVTSVEAKQLNDGFDVYPNPASNSLYVIGDFETARIYNQFGQEVTSSRNPRINIENIPAGVYYVRRDNGIESRKFLKVE